MSVEIWLLAHRKNVLKMSREGTHTHTHTEREKERGNQKEELAFTAFFFQ